jgi:hypothetical protein
MLNSYWLAAPFILQMVCMAADEFWFHRKRGLPRWERIGHPLDTMTVALCLACILCFRPGRHAVLAFVALAVFSCVFVTKDERVHLRYCSATEQRLHAILFLLHPVMLASAALIWPAAWSSPPAWISSVVRYSGMERAFLIFMLSLMLGFCVYQFVFWNLLWQPKTNDP